MKNALLVSFLLSFLLIPSQAKAAEPPVDAPAFDLSLAGAEQAAVSWHGYYEFEYLSAQDKPTTFDAHKITIWMGVQLGERAFLSSEVEYEHAPQLSGSGGAGKIIVDSAQLRLTPAGPAAVYMGVFYVPFGIEYLSYPGHINKLITRPKVMKSGGVIPGTWSDVGVGLTLALGQAGSADFYAVNGDAYHGRVALDSAEGGNESKTLGARIMIDKLIPGLNLGASIAEGKWDKDSKLSSGRVAAHLRADLDKITGSPLAPVIIAEWAAGLDENGSSIEGDDKKVSGYYAQASVKILPKIEASARYGAYDSDGSVKNNAKDELSVGAVWQAMEKIQIKAEYQMNGEQGKEKKNDLLAFQVTAHW